MEEVNLLTEEEILETRPHNLRIDFEGLEEQVKKKKNSFNETIRDKMSKSQDEKKK